VERILRSVVERAVAGQLMSGCGKVKEKREEFSGS